MLDCVNDWVSCPIEAHAARINRCVVERCFRLKAVTPSCSTKLFSSADRTICRDRLFSDKIIEGLSGNVIRAGPLGVTALGVTALGVTALGVTALGVLLVGVLLVAALLVAVLLVAVLLVAVLLVAAALPQHLIYLYVRLIRLSSGLIR